MKTIPAALAQHLKGDATTTCPCWKVTLKDGEVIGFTDHDETIVFGGTSYLAASGFAASDSDSETGLGASAGEVAGGFSSEAIAEDDLAAGRFDGARVELFLVNWQAPDQHMLLNMREIGEVTRAGGAFRAELRSLAHRLGQPQGRIYGRRCDAALGDRRCGVDLEPFTGHGNVVAVDASGGLLAAKSFDLDGHERRDGGVHLSFWLPPEQLPSPGGHFFRHRRLRQEFHHLPGEIHQSSEFPGLPASAGGGFRLFLCERR